MKSTPNHTYDNIHPIIQTIADHIITWAQANHPKSNPRSMLWDYFGIQDTVRISLAPMDEIKEPSRCGGRPLYSIVIFVHETFTILTKDGKTTSIFHNEPDAIQQIITTVSKLI